MNPKRVLAVGEAMLEMAPLDNGHYRLGFAGDTFNTLWHAAQLLGPRAQAGFVTRVGTDSLSGRFVARMAGDGLDVSRVSRDPDHTMGLYLIELDGAERSFHYWRQMSAARHLADDPATLGAALAGADLIHVSGITLAILTPKARETLFAALDDARRAGARVVFDPNIRARLWTTPDETRATIVRMLPFVDIALPSFDDETALWGDRSPADTILRLVGQGVPEVVVKDGPRPVQFRTPEASGRCMTPPVPDLCDTTGAGDAFNAGYLSARLLGASPDDAVATGQALAAIVLRTRGAQADREVVRALASRPRST